MRSISPSGQGVPCRFLPCTVLGYQVQGVLGVWTHRHTFTFAQRHLALQTPRRVPHGGGLKGRHAHQVSLKLMAGAARYMVHGSRVFIVASARTTCSTARQLLDRPRQTSTDLDRPRQTSTDLDAQAHGVRLDRLDRNSTVTRQARQARPRQRLDSASTAPRQRLDSASTAPRRSLDSSTARQPGLKWPRGTRMGVLGNGLGIESESTHRYIPDPSLKRQIPGGAPPPIYG